MFLAHWLALPYKIKLIKYISYFIIFPEFNPITMEEARDCLKKKTEIESGEKKDAKESQTSLSSDVINSQL